MRKILPSIFVSFVLVTTTSADFISNTSVGTNATVGIGKIAGNNSQVFIDLKHSIFLKNFDTHFLTGGVNLFIAQDYKQISAPITLNLYKDFAHKMEDSVNLTEVNVYPFVNIIKNSHTNNKQRFGGFGLSTNFTLQYKNKKIADIEVGGEKSVFDKSTYKYANLFIKTSIPVQDNLSIYMQIGKVFLTDKTTITTTETENLGGNDTTTTTITTTKPTSTTENTFLIGISYSF